MEISRNVSQEKAMTILYDALTYEAMGQDYDVQELIADILDTSYEEADFYVKEVVIKALLHKDTYIQKLEEKMEKWKFSRLNRVNQAILLLSCAHYFEIQETDRAVIIDVAVRLSKKFLDDNDYKFVNAILENVLC